METVQGTHREETQRAQLYNKNDVSITLSHHHDDSEDLHSNGGVVHINIITLKTSDLKNGDCICNM